MTVYENQCFKFATTAGDSTMELDTAGVFRMNASELALNSTSIYPMLFQVIMHRDNRVSFSERVSVSLNGSSAFVIAPSADLQKMEEQLGKVDEMVSKNPKKALGMLGAFASAINERSDESAVAADTGEQADKLTGVS